MTSIGHKFAYYENNIYVITEEERLESSPVELPWNVYQDKVKLAVGYVRWSDKKQDSGHSQSIQERAIIIKAQSLGFQGVLIFVEAATSAYHNSVNKRAKMIELKGFIKGNSNANAVIFYDESRITRDISDFYTGLILPLREIKPKIKFYSTQHEGEWNENDQLVQMRLTYDYESSAKRASAIREFQENIFQDNRRPPASNPYGYSQVNDEEDILLPNENSEIVSFIFYLYSFGYSDKKIAALLELSQVPSPAGYGNWSDSSVRYILNNLWYMGNLVWDSRMSFSNSKKKNIDELRIISNYHSALIETGLWEITQFFRSLKSKKIRMDTPFILKDIVSCKECGENLVTKNQTSEKSKTDASIYFCPKCKCKIKKDALNQVIIQDFADRWGRELKNYPKKIKNEMTNWLRICTRKTTELSKDIEKLRFNMNMLKPTDENYDELLEICRMQLKLLENEKALYINAQGKIEQLLSEMATMELIDRFKQNIHLYNNVEKRSLLLLAIKGITYDFKREKTEIEYRLTPYVEIETMMEVDGGNIKTVV